MEVDFGLMGSVGSRHQHERAVGGRRDAECRPKVPIELACGRVSDRRGHILHRERSVQELRRLSGSDFMHMHVVHADCERKVRAESAYFLAAFRTAQYFRIRSDTAFR